MRRLSTGRRGERGSALVEAAIVTPVFFGLIFGIMEMGLLFRNKLTTNNAAQQGARIASVSGNLPDADYLVIRAIEHGLESMDLEDLDYVVVFRASGPNDVVPEVCKTASQLANLLDPLAPACNRYTPLDFFKEVEDPLTGALTGNFNCLLAALDRFWCPGDRETSLAAGTDYIGIHVQTRHRFITGFLGDGRDLSETRIVRLEPDGN